LIYVCRAHYHKLIIHYHPLCMNIYHEPSVLLGMPLKTDIITEESGEKLSVSAKL
jgi:hypothetical protein